GAAIAVVAVNVEALHPREARSAIDVAPDHRTAFFVAVFGDGHGEAFARALLHEAMVAFHLIPAIVLAARTGCLLEVDLFPGVLPDVADKEVAGRAVEREAPWIAQAVRPDFGADVILTDEGIGLGNGVRGDAGFHVNAQQLSQQLGRILAAEE